MAKKKHESILLSKGVVIRRDGKTLHVRVERDGEDYIAYDEHYMQFASGTSPDDAVKNYRRNL